MHYWDEDTDGWGGCEMCMETGTLCSFHSICYRLKLLLKTIVLKIQEWKKIIS
jgi:hypothetical protein